MSRDPPNSEGESGFALLAVIFALIILSVLTMGIVILTRDSLDEAHNELVSSQANAFGDAVILQTAIALLDQKNPDRPRIDGQPSSIVVFGQRITVSVTSEFGKVDINSADTDALTRLLEAAGMGPAEATETAGQIVTWRTGDAGASVTRPFRIIQELMLVPGITPALFNELTPAITVYSGRDRVDVSTAPLLALEARNMDRQSAETFVRDRAENETNNSFSEIVNGRLQPGTNIIGWAFSASADFEVNGRSEHLDAVVRFTGDDTNPYLILWRDQLPA